MIVTVSVPSRYATRTRGAGERGDYNWRATGMGRWGAIGHVRRRQSVRNRKRRAPPQRWKKASRSRTRARATRVARRKGDPRKYAGDATYGERVGRGVRRREQSSRTDAPDLFAVNTLLTPP